MLLPLRLLLLLLLLYVLLLLLPLPSFFGAKQIVSRQKQSHTAFAAEAQPLLCVCVCVRVLWEQLLIALVVWELPGERKFCRKLCTLSRRRGRQTVVENF